MKTSTNDVVLLFARALMSWIFLFSSAGQMTEFARNVNHVAAAGMPLPQMAIGTSIVLQALCGLAILTGFRMRIAAWGLVLFLIPATLVLHKFWILPSPHLQQIQFSKNMAIMGGLLFAASFHAGKYSVDFLLASRRSRHNSPILPQRFVP